MSDTMLFKRYWERSLEFVAQFLDSPKSLSLKNILCLNPELNWFQWIGDQKKNLKIYRQALTLHVVDRAKWTVKGTKMKTACTCAMRARQLFFIVKYICKFLTFLSPSSSWLRQFPNVRCQVVVT